MLLGELLIHKKLLTKADLDAALLEQKNSKEFLGAILLKMRLIKEPDLLKVLSEQFHIPCSELKPSAVDWAVAMRFSSSIVVDHKCLPMRQDDSGITVAIVNPLDAMAVSLVEEQAKGTMVRPVLVSTAEMAEALRIYKEKTSEKIKKLLEG